MFARMTVRNPHALRLYIAVGIGGMIGAVGRYSVSVLIDGSSVFPYATLMVNLIGCFLLSFLLNQVAIKQRLSPELFTALGTGMIGAFTTFSTFAVETVELADSRPFMALGYVLLSIIGGLAFCYTGMKVANRKRDEP